MQAVGWTTRRGSVAGV